MLLGKILPIVGGQNLLVSNTHEEDAPNIQILSPVLSELSQCKVEEGSGRWNSQFCIRNS